MKRFEKLASELYHPDVQSEVLSYIYILSYDMDARAENITQKYGITRAQFNILSILYEQYPNPASMSTLKERRVIVKSDVSRIVMRLRKACLVDYKTTAKDKRTVAITLTALGHELFTQIVGHKDELLKPFTVFSEEELSQFRTMLRKLLSAMEE